MYFQWTLKINNHLIVRGYFSHVQSTFQARVHLGTFVADLMARRNLFTHVLICWVAKSIDLILLINLKLLWKETGILQPFYRKNVTKKELFIKKFLPLKVAKTCLISYSSWVSTKEKKEKQSGNLMQYFEIFSY